jgi:hypothetical protein
LRPCRRAAILRRADDQKVFLMLVATGLRIVDVTLHESVRTALARIDADLIVQAGRALGLGAVKLGLFGDDDERISKIAVERLRALGIGHSMLTSLPPPTPPGVAQAPTVARSAGRYGWRCPTVWQGVPRQIRRPVAFITPERPVFPIGQSIQGHHAWAGTVDAIQPMSAETLVQPTYP